MSSIAEIQAAVRQLSSAEQHEFSKWVLQELVPETWTDATTDAVALARFQALDAEEHKHEHAHRTAPGHLAGRFRPRGQGPPGVGLPRAVLGA